ncbi:MAG: methyltransferase domain-containing protein [Burkholderiaceae bacterium]|nr:methyltransferase domain-containing protein [Burkholderiaceae bacterium]
MSDSGEGRYVPALGFHWLTPAYDAVVAATTRERRFKQALMAQARLEPGQRVLDLACGTGTLAVWIKRRHPDADVSGIDGDTNILAIAQRKAKRAGVAIRFDQGLATRLPYADARFDRVFSSLFFHHLSWRDKQRSAREIQRVLRPGGELHVADWGRASGPLMRGAFVAIQLLDGFANTRDNVAGRLVELFQDAGFGEVSQQQTFSTVFGTLALYRAVRPS